MIIAHLYIVILILLSTVKNKFKKKSHSDFQLAHFWDDTPNSLSAHNKMLRQWKFPHQHPTACVSFDHTSAAPHPHDLSSQTGFKLAGFLWGIRLSQRDTFVALQRWLRFVFIFSGYVSLSRDYDGVWRCQILILVWSADHRCLCHTRLMCRGRNRIDLPSCPCKHGCAQSGLVTEPLIS